MPCCDSTPKCYTPQTCDGGTTKCKVHPNSFITFGSKTEKLCIRLADIISVQVDQSYDKKDYYLHVNHVLNANKKCKSCNTNTSCDNFKITLTTLHFRAEDYGCSKTHACSHAVYDWVSHKLTCGSLCSDNECIR